VDESEYTIDDGYFAVLVNEDQWQNFPAYRHGGSASLSFADGHSELKKWVEPSTANLKNPSGFSPAPKSGSQRNRDLQWLSDRYIQSGRSVSTVGSGRIPPKARPKNPKEARKPKFHHLSVSATLRLCVFDPVHVFG
jgi:prepilin-type processing-associated H-X9-DG protein